MASEDEWKLANLRPHIWKVSQLMAKYVFGNIWLTRSARGKREEKPTSIIHGNAIDLNTLDIKPTNIFFSSGNGDVTPNSNGEIQSLLA